MPRYAPQFSLPPYAYVPGMHAHPISHPAGHSFQSETPPIDCPIDLRRCESFLRGIDLFNAGYYWEAHEAWEAIWHAQKRAGESAAQIQGLIKLAAAGVKAREGSAVGVARHAARAIELLDDSEGRPLPIQLAELRRLAQDAAAQPDAYLDTLPAPVRVVFATPIRLLG
ncbi:DUF309 domain-containing protein [Blastopirellula retiformator]|uniref:DUF309 domain-containing protein n=1 Tax=Blastopirellula retiformator TaxID=2527970 RepID=A0A5C5V881_9BACT|nr:DUF309 domain-containing protein [Blastopirellula retiformator]TWT34250.1 hypothetical protein Enr8_16440 [Blastopirellula retiformator]